MLTTTILAEDNILTPNLSQAIWVLALFLILAVTLYRTAWKNVLAGLKAREAWIRKEISDAEETRRKAEETLRQYNAQLAGAQQQVRDLLTQAGADAEKIATNVRMRAQQEAEEAKERATKEIEAAKRAALTEIYEQTAILATAVAAKIIRRNLNPDDQRELVSQSLEELRTMQRI